MFRDFFSPPITLTGFDFPVVNERSVRASSGLLLLFGLYGWFELYYTGNPATLWLFAGVVLVELAIRLVLGVRWAPVLLIGSFLVRKQSPEWTALRPRETAWIAGLIYVAVTYFAIAWLPSWVPGWPTWALLASSGIYLAMLFFDSAVGFCLGSWLHSRFSKASRKVT